MRLFGFMFFSMLLTACSDDDVAPNVVNQPLNMISTNKADLLDQQVIFKGKWDDLFDMQLNIEPGPQGEYSALYLWREFQDQPMQQKTLSCVRANQNTLECGDILVILNAKPIAIGVFDSQSRIAQLKTIQ